MNKELIEQVQQKKIFSKLPESVIIRALKLTNNDVNNARSLLRKYFGAFMTNRIIKRKEPSVLQYHHSSKKRDYETYYQEIFEGLPNFEHAIDLGSGANGYSFNKLKEKTGIRTYTGIEASGQIVENINEYFKDLPEQPMMIQEDLLNQEAIKNIIKKPTGTKIFLLLQVIDALEAMKKDYSKQLLTLIEQTMNKKDLLVISWPLKSLGGKNFTTKRQWIKEYLKETFNTKKELVISDEKIFVLTKKDTKK
jgi:hypothetical protein